MDDGGEDERGPDAHSLPDASEPPDLAHQTAPKPADRVRLSGAGAVGRRVARGDSLGQNWGMEKYNNLFLGLGFGFVVVAYLAQMVLAPLMNSVAFTLVMIVLVAGAIAAMIYLRYRLSQELAKHDPTWRPRPDR